MTTVKTKLGVQVARAILTGDVSAARMLAGNRKSWTVPEARAICGACRIAQAKGWLVYSNEFGI